MIDSTTRLVRSPSGNLESRLSCQRIKLLMTQCPLYVLEDRPTPIAAVVTLVCTLEDQAVVASFQVPRLVKLAALSTMTVKAQAAEADVSWI